MPKPLLLLVDSDARALRVLRVSLEQAGYDVRTAEDGESALAEMDRASADVVLTATTLTKLDGYGLVRALRERAEWRSVPVVFLTDKTAIEDRIRGLELGVEHYLAKPIYVRELLSLVGGLVARRLLVRIEQGNAQADGVVSGSLTDLSMLDLLTALERGKASGQLHIRDGKRHGTVFVRDGEVIDASFERLRGEEAIFRALVWPRGKVEFVFGGAEAEMTIAQGTSKLIDAALGYIAEWNSVVEELPGLAVAMCIDLPALRSRVGEIPDVLQGVLQLLDGRHTLFDVIDESPFDDLSTLQTIARLYQEGLATAVPMGAESSDDLPVARADSERGAHDRRPTHPWVGSEDAKEATAVAPDSDAVSEQIVASPLAALEPGKDPGTAAPGGAPAAARASEPPTRRAEPDSLGPGAGSKGAEAEPSGPPAGSEARDFDEKGAESAVDQLVEASSPASAEPKTKQRVIVTASEASARRSVRSKTLLSEAPGEDGERKTDAARTETASAGAPASGPSTRRAAAGADEGAAKAGDKEGAGHASAERKGAGDASKKPAPAHEPSEAPRRAAGESKPAAGESKPAAGESKPAAGESKPAAGESKPAASAKQAPTAAKVDAPARAKATAVARSTEEDAKAAAGGSDAARVEAESPGSEPGSSLEKKSKRASAGKGAEPTSDRAPASHGERKTGEPSGPSSARGRRGAESAGRGAAHDADESPESLRALGESGVSEGFFRQSVAEEEPIDDDAPFSEPARIPLTPEQQARRRSLMRIVGAVVGIAVAVMVFIYVRDPGRHAGSPTARPRPTASTATTAVATTSPSAAASNEDSTTVTSTESADVGDAGASDAAPDAGEGGGAPDAGGEDEALPEVDDPLGEVRKLANSGRYHDAIPMAKAAIKADADNAEGYMYLAEAYRALGKHAEMQAAYDECVARATKGVAMWCPYGKKKAD